MIDTLILFAYLYIISEKPNSLRAAANRIEHFFAFKFQTLFYNVSDLFNFLPIPSNLLKLFFTSSVLFLPFQIFL